MPKHTVATLLACVLALSLVPSAWAAGGQQGAGSGQVGAQGVEGSRLQPLTIEGGASSSPGATASGAPESPAASAAPAVPSSSAASVPWARLWGAGPYDTMRSIVQAGWASGSGGTVVLATSKGHHDALAASGIAGVYGAPVLVTAPGALPSQTRAELARIRPTRVIVVGGPVAVSRAVTAQVGALLPGARVTRSWGATATETAAAANLEHFRALRPQAAILATSRGFQDALSAAPVAYAKRMPVFLASSSSSVSAATLDAMASLGVKRVIVIGGPLAIGQKVVSALSARGISVRARLWGQNAYQTSNAVAKWAVANGMSPARTGAATGASYYDALCGAALCGKANAPIVLVGDRAGACIGGFVRANASKITGGRVFGGVLAVTAATAGSLASPRPDYAVLYKPLLLKAIRGEAPFDSWFGSYAKYAFEDIDSDGVFELIVHTDGNGGGMNSHGFAFTIRNGNVVRCNENAMALHFRYGTMGRLYDGTLYVEYHMPGMYGVNALGMSGTRLTSTNLYADDTNHDPSSSLYVWNEDAAYRAFWATHPKGDAVRWYSVSDLSGLPK